MREDSWAGGHAQTLCRFSACFLCWCQAGSPSQLQAISSEGEHIVARFSKRNPFPHSNLDFQVKCLNFKYSLIVKKTFCCPLKLHWKSGFYPQAASLRTMQTTQRQQNKLWASVYIPLSLWIAIDSYVYRRHSLSAGLGKIMRWIKSHTCKNVGKNTRESSRVLEMFYIAVIGAMTRMYPSICKRSSSSIFKVHELHTWQYR